MQNGEIAITRSSRFRVVSFYGFMIIILWLTLGGNLLNFLFGLNISWLTFGIGVILILLPFTSPLKLYLKKPIDSNFYLISVFVGNILLIILYAIFMISYATDPYVWAKPINKAGLILWVVATALSILSLGSNIITYKIDQRAKKVNPSSS